MWDTNEGSPQGGVISPLLANIALHGMEELVKEYARSLKGKKAKNQQAISLIRYADDFVILAPKANQIIEMHKLVKTWLAVMGLELSPSKTSISHTLKNPALREYIRELSLQDTKNMGLWQENYKEPEIKFADKAGFDFLGFNARQYEVNSNSSGSQSNGTRLGFKTLIKPSKKAIKKHYDAIALIIDAHKAAPQAALIAKLNPIIRGWVNYYSTVVSKETFSTLDHMVYQKLSRWAQRRHPGRAGTWVSRKYWHTVGGDNWVFSATTDGSVAETLIKHSSKPIVRHIKVKGEASPFDGNLKYWSSRRGKHPLVPTRVAKLLKEQKGKCAHCEMYFREDDLIEVDHIIPKSQGGKDVYSNLQALHRHCHDIKTANDSSNSDGRNAVTKEDELAFMVVRGSYDRGQVIEEPDEVKVSCPVLKTNGSGDRFVEFNCTDI
ncbi:HNH endonuclease [Nostoc sp. CHAB 5834]|nr:HNH endonuclease [Nostoc sp. CHAB 5834]